MDKEDFDKRWKQVEDMLTERFGKTPNMEALLLLICIQ